jgi:hypothetical protein
MKILYILLELPTIDYICIYTHSARIVAFRVYQTSNSKSSWLLRALMISNSLLIQLMHTNYIRLFNY